MIKKKKKLQNEDFLRNNKNFNIKIGENEVINTRKNIEGKKKLNFKDDEIFFNIVSIDLNENDNGYLNFTLENNNYIEEFEGREYNIFGPKIENEVIKAIKQDKSETEFGDIKIKVVNGKATCEENCLNINDINDIISKEQGKNNNNKKNEVNLPLIIGVSVGGFVLLAIIVYYFMGKGRGRGRSKGKKSIAKSNNLSNKKGGSRKAGRGRSK